MLLTFDVGDAIKTACDHDSNAMLLARAAQLVRREMLTKKFHFDGSFKPECQQQSVPKSLFSLVNMILRGPNIEHQSEIGTVAGQVLLSKQILLAGTADSFVKASHVTKTRHAHQVTAASLHTLLQKAYSEDINAAEMEVLTLEKWCEIRSQESVQFSYWHKTLTLEITLLLFIRFLRKATSSSMWNL